MGDDPYDFDIAIPCGKAAVPAKGKASAWSGGRHGGSDDSDASDSSGGGSSGSHMSISDSEDFRGKKKHSSASNKAPANRRDSGRGGAASARGGGGGAAAGSSALDKAKSFLSKYSTKSTASTTKATSSARSKRLEMSLDDENFSLDSSGEEIQKPKANTTAATSKAYTARKQPSESEQVEEDSTEPSYSKPTVVSAVVTKPRYEDSEDEMEGWPQPMALKAEVKSTVAPVASRYESEEEESDSPAPVRSTMRASSYGAPLVRAVEKDEDDDDDVESIASHSETEESVEVSNARATAAKSQPTVAAMLNVSKPRQISAMSESGVYEEEDFEEDSVQAANAAMKVIQTQPPNASVGVSRPREEESNFDYSLDFAEDQEPASQPAPVTSGLTAVIREEDSEKHEERRSRSASSSLESNRNSYVDDGEDKEEDEEPDHPTATPEEGYESEIGSEHGAKAATAEELRPAALLDSDNYSQDYGFESASIVMATTRTGELSKPIESREPGSTGSIHRGNGSPSTASAHQTTPASRAEMPQPPALVKAPIQTRSRVVIIREYEQNSSGIEKRDASTQFTGNHAGIQTDLIPDGMLTSGERKNVPNYPPVDHQQSENIARDAAPLNSSSIPPAPTLPQSQQNVHGSPPPPFATYGLYDPLQLPVAASMSIYKQQLMALQQQILQKKLETERIFRDRMASRYGSLRGTDKFLAANRPARIPLWEALLRVDPMLDETRAKEIASLAGSATQ